MAWWNSIQTFFGSNSSLGIALGTICKIFHIRVPCQRLSNICHKNILQVPYVSSYVQVIFGCECFVAYFTSMLILTMGFHMSCKIFFWNKETTDLAEAIHYCECCPKLLIVTKISDFIMFYLPNWSIAQSI